MPLHTQSGGEKLRRKNEPEEGIRWSSRFYRRRPPTPVKSAAHPWNAGEFIITWFAFTAPAKLAEISRCASDGPMHRREGRRVDDSPDANSFQRCRGGASFQPPGMIKAIIFDLDSCLSAADEPGQEFFAPAFDAIKRFTEGSHTSQVLEQAFADMWRLPFDFVARKYNFTPSMLSAGWERLAQLEVTTPMHGYGDLDALKDLPAQLFLVTSGFRRLQNSKIRALGIAPIFAALHVDAIDEPGHRGKQKLFEEILRAHQLQPHEVLIVGDNHDSEIAAGVRLGIRTVQTLRPGVPRSLVATHHIKTLHELRPLLL